MYKQGDLFEPPSARSTISSVSGAKLDGLGDDLDVQTKEGE